MGMSTIAELIGATLFEPRATAHSTRVTNDIEQYYVR